MNVTSQSQKTKSMNICPEGEYIARVGSEPGDVKAESVQYKKDPTKSYVQVTLMWEILDENVKANLKQETLKVRDRFFIDIDPVTHRLAVGTDLNLTLNARRAAVNLNSNVPFEFPMLRGAGPCRVRVKHSTDEGDKTIKFAEVEHATVI